MYWSAPKKALDMSLEVVVLSGREDDFEVGIEEVAILLLFEDYEKKIFADIPSYLNEMIYFKSM